MATLPIPEFNMAFHAEADNFYPHRSTLYGTLEAFSLEYAGRRPSRIYTLRLAKGVTTPVFFNKAAFMLDGEELGFKPYYIAGYSRDKREFYLHPMSNGLGKGPQRFYFLTLTKKLTLEKD